MIRPLFAALVLMAPLALSAAPASAATAGTEAAQQTRQLHRSTAKRAHAAPVQHRRVAARRTHRVAPHS
jgi:hypothetical protein